MTGYVFFLPDLLVVFVIHDSNADELRFIDSKEFNLSMIFICMLIACVYGWCRD